MDLELCSFVKADGQAEHLVTDIVAAVTNCDVKFQKQIALHCSDTLLII